MPAAISKDLFGLKAADAAIMSASFEPVREVSGYRLGWMTVEARDVTLRFPAVVYQGECVAAVRDWQAPMRDIDLSKRDSLREMMWSGQHQFVRPRTGTESVVIQRFLV